jgi:hypothetical protein
MHTVSPAEYNVASRVHPHCCPLWSVCNDCRSAEELMASLDAEISQEIAEHGGCLPRPFLEAAVDRVAPQLEDMAKKLTCGALTAQ